MKITYRGYPFEPNGFSWQSAEQLLTQNGIGYARVRTVAVSGLNPGTSQVNCAVKSAALQSAVRQPAGDLMLRTTGGQLLESLLSAGALIPVQCISGPTFNGVTGAEFVNYRQVSMVFQATYPTTTGIIIIEQTTSLNYTQPFPTVVWQPAQNGKAQKQTTTGIMPGTMVQSGSITSRNGQVPLPKPLFAPTLITQAPIENRTQRLTPYGPEYMLQYGYVFQSTSPF